MDRYNGAQWYSGSTGSDFDRVNWIGLRSCLHSALYLLNTSLLSVSMVPYINIKKIFVTVLAFPFSEWSPVVLQCYETVGWVI